MVVVGTGNCWKSPAAPVCKKGIGIAFPIKARSTKGCPSWQTLHHSYYVVHKEVLRCQHQQPFLPDRMGCPLVARAGRRAFVQDGLPVHTCVAAAKGHRVWTRSSCAGGADGRMWALSQRPILMADARYLPQRLGSTSIFHADGLRMCTWPRLGPHTRGSQGDRCRAHGVLPVSCALHPCSMLVPP